MNDHTVMILKALEVKEMTQSKLAAYSGICVADISSIISYKRTMSVQNAIKISNALKVCSAKDLLFAQVEWQLKQLAILGK